MKIQILHAFTIQSQPRLDICVFSVARSAIRISLLDLPCAFPVDLRKHCLERYAKNRALRSTPAAPVGQRLCELEDLAGEFHSEKSINCRATAPVAKHCRSGDPPALHSIHNFAYNLLRLPKIAERAMPPPYNLSMISRRSCGPR